MTATRLGLWNGKFLSLFPRKLENTATSPTLLPAQNYARELRNILPNAKKAGSGAVRFGMGKKGSPATQDLSDGCDYRKADGTLEKLLYTVDGVLSRFDEGAGTYVPIKTGLSVDGLFGSLQFNGKLICWNGVNNNFAYDGSTCTDLAEFVSDKLATNYTWLSTSSISLKPNHALDDYANGRAIRVTFGTAGLVTATVVSTSYDAPSNTLTINVSGAPFPALLDTIDDVEYWEVVPPMSFIYAEHDILWGLSAGLAHPTQYRGADSLKVFFTTAPNNENAWFDQGTVDSTQEPAYFNIRNKARVFDELLAISSFNGVMVFHGRLQTYLYSGDDPGTAGGIEYEKTIKVGLVHQKLVQPFPGDLVFVTPYGARSLSSVIESETLEVQADIGSDVDPTFSEKIVSLLVDVGSYRRARSFYYARDGIFGFKLEDTSLMVYALNEKSKGWTQFDGFFADASCFYPTGDNRLLIGRGSQLYAFGNGSDSSVGTVYSDDGEAVAPVWHIPWLQGADRWSNRAFEVLVEGTDGVTITLDRFINLNDRNTVTSQITISGTGSKWDAAEWDEDEWDGDVYNPVVSDKFLADSFSVRLSALTTMGPINILGLRPIGR